MAVKPASRKASSTANAALSSSVQPKTLPPKTRGSNIKSDRPRRRRVMAKLREGKGRAVTVAAGFEQARRLVPAALKCPRGDGLQHRETAQVSGGGREKTAPVAGPAPIARPMSATGYSAMRRS